MPLSRLQLAQHQTFDTSRTKVTQPPSFLKGKSIISVNEVISRSLSKPCEKWQTGHLRHRTVELRKKPEPAPQCRAKRKKQKETCTQGIQIFSHLANSESSVTAALQYSGADCWYWGSIVQRRSATKMFSVAVARTLCDDAMQRPRGRCKGFRINQ
jgi:hypothetical protein